MSQNRESALAEQVQKLREALSELQGQDLPEKTQSALSEFEHRLDQLSQTPPPKPSEDILNEKAEFVSLVSHELRVPMTSIKGYTDIILNGMVGEVNDQQREFLTVIANNVTRMSELIADLRDITRLETGRTQLDIKAISLATCAAQAVSNIESLINAEGHVIHSDFPPDLPTVSADPLRVIQVLTVILRNAAMYSGPGSAIRLNARQIDSHVEVEVEDEGFGIIEEDRPKVFDAFFRSDSSRVREHQGWGLGLNVAWNAIQAMAGEIGIKDKTGQGTIFWFTLPVA